MTTSKDERIAELEQSNEALRNQVVAQTRRTERLEDDLAFANDVANQHWHSAMIAEGKLQTQGAITAWAMGFE